jgi:hypothetical protein
MEQQDDRAEHETAEHGERERSSARPRVPSRQPAQKLSDNASSQMTTLDRVGERDARAAEDERSLTFARHVLARQLVARPVR